jgi:hypothetical protein
MWAAGTNNSRMTGGSFAMNVFSSSHLPHFVLPDAFLVFQVHGYGMDSSIYFGGECE